MKKITFLLTVLCVSAFALAQETLIASCDFTKMAASHQNYNDSWVYGDWTVFGAANNNAGWAYAKFGGKSTTISQANPCYIFGQVEQAVGKIVVNTNAANLSKAGSVNEWGVKVYSDDTKTNLIGTILGGTMTKSKAEALELIPETAWPAGSYYQVYFDMANTTTTNGIVWIDKIDFYEGEVKPETPYSISWNVNGTEVRKDENITNSTLKDLVLPEVQDDAIGACANTFVGWSTTNIGATAATDAPEDLFSIIANAPRQAEEVETVTFYAVFANATTIEGESLVQTLEYDTWTYGGTSSDKSNYRLFGNGGYVESEAFDLSALTKVIVYGGTYGGNTYNGLDIKDAFGNIWKSVTVTGSKGDGFNEYDATGAKTLTGVAALRIVSKVGDASANGVRISKVEIFCTDLTTYSDYVTSCNGTSTAIDNAEVANKRSMGQNAG